MASTTSHGGTTSPEWYREHALEMKGDATQVTWGSLHDWLDIEWVNQDLFRITQPIPGTGEAPPFSVYGMWQAEAACFLPLCVVKTVSAFPVSDKHGNKYSCKPSEAGELSIPESESGEEGTSFAITVPNVSSQTSLSVVQTRMRRGKARTGVPKYISSHSLFGYGWFYLSEVSLSSLSFSLFPSLSFSSVSLSLPPPPSPPSSAVFF